MERAKKKIKKVKEQEKDLKKFQKLASSLDGLEIEFRMKVKEDGTLVEKISPTMIVEKLKEMGFPITRKQILMKGKITELGEFPIKIIFPHNLESEIKVIVLQD